MAKTKSIAKKLIGWRIWVQAAFLLVWLDPFAARLHTFCSPVFHCYACPLATFACPIGVLAHFSALHLFPFIAVGTLVLLGGIFGGFICGWACPFGLLQDLADKVPTPKIKLPRSTGHLRYVVLIGLVLIVPYFWGIEHPIAICNVCPAGGLEAAVPNIVTQATTGQEITWPNPIKLTVMALFVITIFFAHRPWCQMLCPLGVIFGLFNRASAFFLRFHPTACNSCKICHDKCKFGDQPEKQINASNCIRCLECTKCPPDALVVETIFTVSKKDDFSSKPTSKL